MLHMFTPGTKLVRAIKAQIAVDGSYENALQFHLPYTNFDSNEVNQHIADFKQTVSAEFFYTTSDGRTSYIGIKYTPQTMPLISAGEFASRCLSTFANSQGVDEFVSSIGIALNNDKSSFLHTAPAQVELGVNEWWFTYGPLLVWKAGDPPVTHEQLVEKLSDRGDIRVNPKNFVGAEVIFTHPIEHWISTQVSEPTHEGYTLNLDQVLAVIDSAVLLSDSTTN